MFESKYSKVLTIILVIVIVAIVILLGFLGFDYIKKYNASKQASDFVEDYQGDITTDEENNTEDNNSQENIVLDSSNEVAIDDIIGVIPNPDNVGVEYGVRKENV